MTTLTFGDEFNSLSLHATWQPGDNWQLISPDSPDGRGGPNYGEGGLQWWVNPFNPNTPDQSLYSVSDGQLNLGVASTSASEQAYIDQQAGANRPFVGTLINTSQTNYQQYGYWDIGLSVDATPGLSTEVAIENNALTGHWPPQLTLGISTDANGNQTIEEHMNFDNQQVDYSAPIAAGSTHDLAVDWEADEITFYADGQAVLTTPNPGGVYQSDSMFAYIYTGVDYSIGSSGTPSDGGQSDGHVDYFRVYDSNPGTSPSPATTPDVTPPDVPPVTPPDVSPVPDVAPLPNVPLAGEPGSNDFNIVPVSTDIPFLLEVMNANAVAYENYGGNPITLAPGDITSVMGGSATDAAGSVYTIQPNPASSPEGVFGEVVVNGVLDDSLGGGYIDAIRIVDGVAWFENAKGEGWATSDGNFGGDPGQGDAGSSVGGLPDPANSITPPVIPPVTPPDVTPPVVPPVDLPVDLPVDSSVVPPVDPLDVPPTITIAPLPPAPTVIDSNIVGISSVDNAWVNLTQPGVAQIVLGDTDISMQFMGMTGVSVVGGTGQAALLADIGTNSFIAGSGALAVTGGSGADNFFFGQNSGNLTVNNFSTAEGDQLFVQASLQSAFAVTPDGNGGSMLSFGTSTGAIDLIDVSESMLPTIHFS